MKLIKIIICIISIFVCISCNKEDSLPEGGEYIPGIYEGGLNVNINNPPKGHIYIDRATATVSKIDDYYTIEFEKNDSIPLPLLNLKVVGSDSYSVNFNIMEPSRYSIGDGQLLYNRFVIVLDNNSNPNIPHVKIGLSTQSYDYNIFFNGIHLTN